MVKGRVISDKRVRRIATDWLKGTGPLTALATSGAIVDGVLDEIDYCLGIDAAQLFQTDLQQLRRYVIRNGVRGPVEGWSKIQF